jgi:hypothetical protein
MIYDRSHHLVQRRITYLLRCALGDLFLGPYSIFYCNFENRSFPEPLATAPIIDALMRAGGSFAMNNLAQAQCQLRY